MVVAIRTDDHVEGVGGHSQFGARDWYRPAEMLVGLLPACLHVSRMLTILFWEGLVQNVSGHPSRRCARIGFHTRGCRGNTQGALRQVQSIALQASSLCPLIMGKRMYMLHKREPAPLGPKFVFVTECAKSCMQAHACISSPAKHTLGVVCLLALRPASREPRKSFILHGKAR